MALEERLARHAASKVVDGLFQEPELDSPNPHAAVDRGAFRVALEEEIYSVLTLATGTLRKKIETLERLMAIQKASVVAHTDPSSSPPSLPGSTE